MEQQEELMLAGYICITDTGDASFALYLQGADDPMSMVTQLEQALEKEAGGKVTSRVPAYVRRSDITLDLSSLLSSLLSSNQNELVMEETELQSVSLSSSRPS